MNKKKQFMHKLPLDFKKVLISKPKALKLWKEITPLAQNEWICWITSGKLKETRDRRIQVGISKLESGMRRPCCWAGCPHR